jgi:hypothetical protein
MYLIAEDDVIVVAFAHASQDLVRHLGKDPWITRPRTTPQTQRVRRLALTMRLRN